MELKRGDHVQIKNESEDLPVPHHFTNLGILQVQSDTPENTHEDPLEQNWHVRQAGNATNKRTTHLIKAKYFIKL